MSSGTPSSSKARRLVITASLMVAFLSAGCVSAVDEAADHYAGTDDWRPPDPEQEAYLVHRDDGFRAPHPFRYEGPVETVIIQGFHIEATTGGLSASHIIQTVDARFPDDVPDPEEVADDPTLRRDLEAGRDVLHLAGGDGHVATDDGAVPFMDETLYITSSDDGIAFEGRLDLDIHHTVSLDGGVASLHFAGYPFPIDPDAPGVRPDLAAVPQDEARIPDVRVRWGEVGEDGQYENDVNGTVVLQPGVRVILGAPAFRFAPDSFHVLGPDNVGSALGGYRTVEEQGAIRLLQTQGVIHLRDDVLTFDEVAVHVTGLERFDYNGTLSMLEMRGGAVQLTQGTRPWIESEIEIAHPSRDGNTLTVTLRVPPGKTFRTMLGVQEVSGVGSAMDIRPTPGRNDGHIEIRLGDRWEDERVLDDRLSRALIDTVASMFWIPDGQVRLGPHAEAWLPVSFDVPEGLEKEAEVELVLHARNAEVLHVLFVLVPDASAGTSDVPSKTPVPLWVPLVAVGIVAAVLRRRR